jgi:HEAT repeat protein
LQENITALAFSGQAWPAAVPKQGMARQVLEECLSIAFSGMRDSGRERLSQFAWDQGFARQWQRACSHANPVRRKHAIALLAAVSRGETRALMESALADPDAAIRTEAARALLSTGDTAMVDRIFRAVLAESLLVRVLLTADLKRHARFLLAETVPAVLAESQSQQIVHCLEILSAWKLAIPGFDIAPLLDRLEHLPLVVALLPYVQVPDTVEDHLRSALETPDLEVRCAAAHAAGQLKLHALLPTLMPLLNLNARLAAASAKAMAQMGPEGERHLHAVLAAGDRKASAAAMEALETLAVGVQ